MIQTSQGALLVTNTYWLSTVLSCEKLVTITSAEAAPDV